jgi:hypothetical protein
MSLVALRHVLHTKPAIRTTCLFLSVVVSLGLMICQPAAKAQVGTSAGSSGACGPPHYCARTDRKIEPYPKTPPVIGPAGAIITDPTFGSRIVRVTDEKSDRRSPGGRLTTPAGAIQNSWNATDTMFYVLTGGGGFLLYDFDPATLAAHQRGNPRWPWRALQFSFANPNLLYGVTEQQPEIEQYDVSNGKTSTINDPSKCLSLKSNDRAMAFSVSADDKRFLIVLGPEQDRDYILYLYDRDKGCRWYNTQTGEVGGQWGPKGMAALDERYGVHNAHLSKSGKYVMIGRGQGPPGPSKWRIWDVETLQVTVCPSKCAGHQSVGYSHVLNTGGDHPLAVIERPIEHLDSMSQISDAHGSPGYWYDSHLSWLNADPEDTNPVCLSTYRPSNPATPGTPLDVNGPWENEILCMETDGKGSKAWRFAHTYSTAKNGFWSQPRGNVSPDGRFYMFTSDWQDQLGKGPDGKYRTDVFIVELR